MFRKQFNTDKLNFEQINGYSPMLTLRELFYMIGIEIDESHDPKPGIGAWIDLIFKNESEYLMFLLRWG